MLNTKRLLLTFATLLLCLTAVVAAGQKDASVAQTPTLTLATADNTYGLSTDPELQGAITALIESKTGTKINPIIPPACLLHRQACHAGKQRRHPRLVRRSPGNDQDSDHGRP